MIREYTHRVNYPGKNLKLSDLEDNPFKQFQQWYEFAKSTEQNTTFEPNAMSLATVGEQGQPHVRVVLMKRFDESGLVFFTNYNSVKGQDLETHPKASVLFWWPHLFQQIRIEGRVTVISAEESDEYFAARPLPSRVAASVSHQSAELESKQHLIDCYEALLKQSDDGANLSRPSYWGGYRLQPARYEFWQGADHRLHDRFQYKIMAGEWRKCRLSP